MHPSLIAGGDSQTSDIDGEPIASPQDLLQDIYVPTAPSSCVVPEASEASKLDASLDAAKGNQNEAALDPILVQTNQNEPPASTASADAKAENDAEAGNERQAIPASPVEVRAITTEAKPPYDKAPEKLEAQTSPSCTESPAQPSTTLPTSAPRTSDGANQRTWDQGWDAQRGCAYRREVLGPKARGPLEWSFIPKLDPTLQPLDPVWCYFAEHMTQVPCRS